MRCDKSHFLFIFPPRLIRTFGVQATVPNNLTYNKRTQMLVSDRSDIIFERTICSNVVYKFLKMFFELTVGREQTDRRTNISVIRNATS